MSAHRRFTFGNDTSLRDDMDSMMTDDFDRMRERFHNRARNMRMDNGFDQSWLDQDRESAFHPRAYKIPKEDERSAYVRNIPIFTEDDSNLMRQTTSSVPKPVPPPNPPPNEPAGSRFSARNDFPSSSGFPSSFPSRPTVRNFPSNGSDSGIDRAASNSPTDISDSTSSASFPRFPASSRSRDTYSPPNLRKPKVVEEPVIKVEKVQNQESAPTRKDAEPIPMGFLPTRRNPSEPIPMGYERPASAPMDHATPQKNEKPKPTRSNLEKTESGPSAKVHRVPIVVKQAEFETPRSASAPPKPTETTPPPSAAPKPKSPLEKIEDIIGDVQKLEARVSSFSGTRGDHEYRLLDELLTQAVLKLDVVTTEGLEEVRNARKKAIKRAHDAISALESKTPVGGKKTEKTPEKSPTPAGVVENKGKSPTPETAAPNAGPHRIVIAMNPEKEKKSDDVVTGSAANGNQTKETLIN